MSFFPCGVWPSVEVEHDGNDLFTPRNWKERGRRAAGRRWVAGRERAEMAVAATGPTWEPWQDLGLIWYHDSHILCRERELHALVV